MAFWRFLCVLLLLTRVALAENQPTARQVIQYWTETQREMPVEKVSFSRLTTDHIFKSQTIQVGEIFYTGDSSAKVILKPWPADANPIKLRSGYKLASADTDLRVSWNPDQFSVHESDGTLGASYPRFRQYLWFPPHDLLENHLPPLFPGPVNEAYIAKFDWKITARKPDAVWLKAVPKLDPTTPTWEVIVNTSTWTIKAVRRLDWSGHHEVVMVVR